MARKIVATGRKYAGHKSLYTTFYTSALALDSEPLWRPPVADMAIASTFIDEDDRRKTLLEMKDPEDIG